MAMQLLLSVVADDDTGGCLWVVVRADGTSPAAPASLPLLLMGTGFFFFVPLVGEVTIWAAKRSTSKLLEPFSFFKAVELFSDDDLDVSTSAVMFRWFMSLMIDGSFLI